MIFQVFNFKTLLEERGKYIKTEKVVACGHPWYLKIYPRGRSDSNADTEYVSVYLCYAGTNGQSNPVLAKANIKTKNIDTNKHFPVTEFSKKTTATTKRGY